MEWLRELYDKTKKIAAMYTGTFVAIMILNQLLFFGFCLNPVCLIAAMPHVLFLTVLIGSWLNNVNGWGGQSKNQDDSDLVDASSEEITSLDRAARNNEKLLDVITISQNILGRILGRVFGKVVTILVNDDSIVFVSKNPPCTLTVPVSEIVDIPTITDGFLGSKLLIQHDDNDHVHSFLAKNTAHQAFRFIENRAIKNIASTISSANEVFLAKAVNEYLRDSSLAEIDRSLGTILSNYNKSKSKWKSLLSQEGLSTLVVWGRYLPLSKGKHELRSQYETKQLVAREKFFDSIESNPLTEQQRLAVIRNNDRNLVLAAAGTGKTSVMVAKALDLIESGNANNDEILVLAYNKAAAEEIKERTMNRGASWGISGEEGPEVSTFHALGRKILRDSSISTYLSDFADDPIKLEMWVTKWLTDYIKSSPASLSIFLELSHQPINPFDFKTKSEYDAYIRDNEYRTLQAEKVKGYQELLIANWLFINGVEYEYEAPYVSKRRIEIGFDYRPDFHIQNTSIYLEHFGTDRNGHTRNDIDRAEYNEGIINKRLLHEELETTLIETFHYDWVEGNLEIRLAELMEEHDIETSQISQDEIFEVLNEQGYIAKSAVRYLKCLQAIRTERLDEESTLARLNANNIVNADKYTDLLGALHESYKIELELQQRIDFDDMIIKSINAVTEGLYKPKWKHILVDEFQDISMARMEFLQALIGNGPTPVLTVVGDDWQAIYRFSGGKLELTTRFEDMVGSHTLTKIEKTFRYNNSIADIAGTFIMSNPEQYKKDVVTHSQVDSSQVYLLDSKVGGESLLEDRIAQVVKTIRGNDADGSIAVLARYRYLLAKAKHKMKDESPGINIKYWTFHGSKGLEADYCILVGFFQGKTGFPNTNKEEAVIEALLPSLDTFPHSEERRLLYVAITRARKKSYLIADPMAPSEFINELLSPKYDLYIGSETFAEKYRSIFKCPLCTDGYFRLISGKYGKFYSCTSGSVCPSKPRVCEKCGAPSVDTRTKSICNNSDCRDEKIICDKCGRPMKLRDGRFGQFLGCTGYGIKEDRCKNTRKCDWKSVSF